MGNVICENPKISTESSQNSGSLGVKFQFRRSLSGLRGHKIVKPLVKPYLKREESSKVINQREMSLPKIQRHC